MNVQEFDQQISFDILLIGEELEQAYFSTPELFFNGKTIADSNQIKKSCFRNIFIKSCVQCNVVKTPQWREGPLGKRSLCNACGVSFLKNKRKKK